MSALDKLLKNKSFVSFLSKKLGNVLKQEGIKSLFVVLNEKSIENISVDDVQFNKEDMVCVPKDIFKEMVEAVKNYHQLIKEQNEKFEIEYKENGGEAL